MSELSGILSMCRRAGKLTGGMDEVKGTCLRREAKCVLTARDFSDNSRSEIERLCVRRNIPLIPINETMDDIGYYIGKRFGVMSVTDKGFAEAIMKKLNSKQ